MYMFIRNAQFQGPLPEIDDWVRRIADVVRTVNPRMQAKPPSPRATP